MALSLIHFGDIIFGGIDGIIDYLCCNHLLARTANCGMSSLEKIPKKDIDAQWNARENHA